MIRTLLVWTARFGMVLFVILIFTTTLTDVWKEIRFNLYYHLDKVSHLISMFGLTLLCLLALPTLRAPTIFLTMILLAALIEFAQLFSHRSADMIDFLSGVAGTACVAIAYYCEKLREGDGVGDE
ncbi:MAG: hypothetical protein AAGK70_12840 [Pseudomonadota bacterium]